LFKRRSDSERKKEILRSHTHQHHAEHRHTVAWSIFGQVLRFLGWMAGFGGLVAWSTCPFCGQSGCPVGAGTTGIMGGLFALCMTNWKRLIEQVKTAFGKNQRV